MQITTFEWIYVGGLAAGTVVRTYYGIRRGLKRRESWETPLDRALVALAGLGFLLPILSIFSRAFSFADYDLPQPVGWAGAAVYAAAVCLLWKSHHDLGGNWSARIELREGHTLVTTGVYTRIRHPMYTAHLLWALAQISLVPNWIAGPSLLALFIPLMVVRIPREERMMIASFGDEYREYMKRTGLLLPAIKR